MQSGADLLQHRLKVYFCEPPAQPAHPADRFAHEIAAILECDTMRWRRLIPKPLGGKVSLSDHAGYSGAEMSASSALDEEIQRLRKESGPQ